MAILRLVPPSGPAIEISRDQSAVGRDPTCEVVVSDGSVSRKHARIERRGAEWAVVDQGSANGTFVDSQRVAELVLRNGQELRFGAVSFRVETEVTEDLAATVAGVTSPEATVVSTPPPVSPRVAAPPPAPLPRSSPPRPSPPPPPSAAAARDRFRATAPPPVPSAGPVLQISGPPPSKKGRGPFFWIGAGCCGCLALVLALFGIIGGSLFLMTKGAVEAVQGELRLIKAGNVEAAYEGLAESYRSEMSRKQFERLIASHPGLKDNAQALFWPPVGSVKVENDVGHLTGVLVSGSGQRETATFDLRKENGAWRITGIHFEGSSAGDETGPSDDSLPARGQQMETETLELNKDPSDGSTRVTIKTRTRGFALRREGSAYRIDLAGDLETTGPGGTPVPGLTKSGFYSLSDTTRSPEGAYADFKTDLTFSQASPGRYVARITIRDKIGGGRMTHRVNFDLP